MVFNSITFLIFLAVVLALYYRLGHRLQNWMLLAASYLFYGWWDYRFLGLLLTHTTEEARFRFTKAIEPVLQNLLLPKARVLKM
jgi:D-alanyl-lipoteichoic acid acyltransferase DltB (MBOAT superfamily)